MAREDAAKAAKQDKGNQDKGANQDKGSKKKDKKGGAAATTGGVPEKPDRDALEKEVKKLNAKIEECKALIDGVKQTLDKRQEEKKNNNNDEDEDEKKLKKLRAVTKKHAQARKKIFDEMSGHSEERERVRKECDEMQKLVKDAGGCSTIAQVDRKVQDLEHYLSTTGLSLKEEKKVIGDIKNLNNSKQAIGKLSSLRDRRSALEKAGREFSSRLDESKKLLEAARDEQNKQFEICKAKRQSENDKNNVKALIESRNKARKEMNNAYDKRRELQEDFYGKQNAWRAYQDEKYKERKAREQEAQAAYKEEKKLNDLRKAEENEENLNADLFASIEQLKFVLGEMRKQNVKPEQEDSQADLASFADKNRTLIGKAAKQMDDDIYGTKVQKKAKKGKKKAKKAAGITFDLQTLAEFATLKLQAPMTLDDFDETLKQLDAKRTELEDDKKKAREKRIADLAKLEAEQAAKATKEGEKKKPEEGDKPAAAAVEATA